MRIIQFNLSVFLLIPIRINFVGTKKKLTVFFKNISTNLGINLRELSSAIIVF